MARRFRSIKDEPQRTDLSESFQALKYVPRFFSEIWQTGKWMFILTLLCRILAALVPIVMLWVGKLIIDEIILQISMDNPDYKLLWTYLAIELGLALISDLLGRAISLTDGLLGDLYSNASSVRIIHKTKDMEISQFEDPEFYDKLERARTQTNGRVSLMSNTLAQMQSLISAATLVGGLIYFEPWLIGLLAISIIPAFFNEIRYSQKQYSLARSWTAERRELDYLRYIGANYITSKEVKLFGLTDFIANRFRMLSDAYYDLNKRLALRRSLFGFLFNMLGVMTYYGAYVLIIYRVLTGSITIGELTFLSGSFSRLRRNLQEFFGQFTRISQSALYLKDYYDFLDIERATPNVELLELPDEIREGFEFINIHFSYPKNRQEVLKGVSFEIKKGEKVAFVGQNGAGKTTLIKLLLRFYEPDKGKILLDGVDIRRYPKEAYQRFFGVIFQDFFKYDFTLRENIAVGEIGEIEDQKRIEKAAELSLAKEVVAEMEEGYEQQLGKRFTKGQDLSGGQWQKVALARAYMKDARVMILDEPTSALDAKAEYEVFERLIGLTEGRTSIIISHRFSTVRMADRIIVLKDGLIHESGSHEELMAAPKLYAYLFNLQATGYQ